MKILDFAYFCRLFYSKRLPEWAAFGRPFKTRPASSPDVERVEFLTKYGSTIEAMNARKWTPLHAASFDGHKDVVEHLAAKGANLDAKTIDGSTPLIYAAQEGHQDIVKFLLEKGADVNATMK